MKVAYITPESQYKIFHWLPDYLRSHSFDVSVNDLKDVDCVLATILPITHEWYTPILASGKPIILWHWDLYSFADYNKPHWQQYLSLLDKAADIWSCSYETARQLKEATGLDSVIIPAWIDQRELQPVESIKDYVFYAATSHSIGKRVDWAERACQISGFRFLGTKGQSLPRKTYLRLISECRVYLMTAFEESNGSIPAMEAAAAGRPVVCADIQSNREVFGSDAYYFNNWEFESCLKALQLAWYERSLPNLRNRIIRCYDQSVVFPKIVRRLEELHDHCLSRPDRGRDGA